MSAATLIQPGTFLSQIGGLPPVKPEIGNPKSEIRVVPNPPKVELMAAPASPAAPDVFNQLSAISPSLAAVLRPQAAYRWLLPYVAAITPTYVESTLRGALAGNHFQAWELFDLMIDSNPEIASCVGEYIDGISEKKLIIEPYHEEDEQPTPTAIRNQKIVSAALRNMNPDPANDENALRGTIRDILFSRFHGASVLEEDCSDPATGQLNRLKVNGVGSIIAPRCTYWVHPVCYAWDMNGRLGLRAALANQLAEASQSAKTTKPGQREREFLFGGQGGTTPGYITDFPKNKFLISIFKAKAGTALAASCLRSLAAWWVFENFSADYAMDLAQIFGIPFRTATFSANTSERDKAFVREMLQNMGSRGWAMLPEGVTLQFERAMATGADSPQGFLIKLCHEQYRKVILRQTMTGSGHGGASSGSKAGMGTEADVKQQCFNAGAQFTCEILRGQAARHILMVNIGSDAELPFISMLDESEGGAEEAQTISTLVSAGAGKAIGLKWVGKKFNIPVPQPGEETLADGQIQPAPTAPGSAATEDPKNPVEPKPGEEDPKAKAAKDAKKGPELAAGFLEQIAKLPDMKAGETVTVSNPDAQHHDDYCSCGKKMGGCRCSGTPRKLSVTKYGCPDCKKAAAETVELKAGDVAAEKPATSNLQLATHAAAALAEMAAPLVKYLKAGLEISDPALQRHYFERALAKWPELTQPIQHDPTLADTLTPALVKTFVAGLAGNPKTEITASAPLEAGDGEFHGNQYVTIADEKWTGTPKEMHARAAAVMKGFTAATHPQLGEVKFTGQGRHKTLFDKRTPHEFQSVAALPELVQKGKLVSSAPDRKGRPEIVAVHKLEHGLQIGDAKYRAELTVKETTDGRKTSQRFYLHRIAHEK